MRDGTGASDDNGARQKGNEQRGAKGSRGEGNADRAGRQAKEERSFLCELAPLKRQPAGPSRVISAGSVLKAKTKATKKNNGVAAGPRSGPEELRVG